MLAGEDTLFRPLLGSGRGGGVRATVSDDPFLSVHRRERLITIQAALHSVRPVTLTVEDRYALIAQSHHSGETFLYALMSKPDEIQDLCAAADNEDYMGVSVVDLDGRAEACVWSVHEDLDATPGKVMYSWGLRQDTAVSLRPVLHN